MTNRVLTVLLLLTTTATVTDGFLQQQPHLSRHRRHPCKFRQSLVLRSGINSRNAPEMITFDDNDEEMDDDEYELLSYLPDQGELIPPRFKEVVVAATKSYVYNGDPFPYKSIADIIRIIEIEHRSRDVPVNVDDCKIDVTKTGNALDEYISEILSVSAIYTLPAPIVLELLNDPVIITNDPDEQKNWDHCKQRFLQYGWNAVEFPRGLAIRPKTATRWSSSRQKTQTQPPSKSMSWWHRPQTLKQIATRAVQQAAQTQTPPRKILDESEFLETLQSSIRQLPALQTQTQLQSSSALSMAYFREDVPVSGIRRVQRFLAQKYNTLKKKGRAGIVSYCFFNFAYYTIGMWIYWPQVAALTTTTTMTPPNIGNGTPSSVATILLAKFGKTFGILYAVSQLFKIPKVLFSIFLAPMAEYCLRFCKTRLRISENWATALLIAGMVVAWGMIVAIPILSEYSTLLRQATSAYSSSSAVLGWPLQTV